MYVIKGGNWRNSSLSNENPVIFTHPHVAPNRCDILSPVEHKKRIVPVSLFIAVSLSSFKKDAKRHKGNIISGPYNLLAIITYSIYLLKAYDSFM